MRVRSREHARLVWLLMSVIPALQGRRKGDQEIKTRLGYIMNSSPALRKEDCLVFGASLVYIISFQVSESYIASSCLKKTKTGTRKMAQ